MTRCSPSNKLSCRHIHYTYANREFRCCCYTEVLADCYFSISCWELTSCWRRCWLTVTSVAGDLWAARWRWCWLTVNSVVGDLPALTEVLADCSFSCWGPASCWWRCLLTVTSVAGYLPAADGGVGWLLLQLLGTCQLLKMHFYDELYDVATILTSALNLL